MCAMVGEDGRVASSAEKTHQEDCEMTSDSVAAAEMGFAPCKGQISKTDSDDVSGLRHRTT